MSVRARAIETGSGGENGDSGVLLPRLSLYSFGTSLCFSMACDTLRFSKEWNSGRCGVGVIGHLCARLLV